jgi:hypothetical protein
VTHQGVTTTAGTATTDATGHYSLSFKPTTSGMYQVQSAQLTQVENASLTPTFSDLLAPSSVPVGNLVVKAHPAITKVSVHNSTLTVRGPLHPLVLLMTGTLSLQLEAPGASSFKKVKTESVAKGTKTFTLTAHLAKPGKYKFTIKYAIAGQVSGGSTTPRSITRS